MQGKKKSGKKGKGKKKKGNKVGPEVEQKHNFDEDIWLVHDVRSYYSFKGFPWLGGGKSGGKKKGKSGKKKKKK